MLFDKITQGRFLVELSLLAVLSFVVSFYSLMFSQEFALIYGLIILSCITFLILDLFGFDRKLSFPIERQGQNKTMGILLAIGIYAGFLLVSSLITNALSPGTLPNSVLDIIKSISKDLYQASTPALAGSVILMFIGWGLVIPIVETIFFNGVIFEFVHDFFIKSKNNVSMVVLCLLVGALAAVFHLTVRQGSSVGLITTFVFFTASAISVWRTGSLYVGIIVHVISNSIAIGLPLLGSVTLASVLPIIGVLVGVWVLLKLVNKQPVFG